MPTLYTQIIKKIKYVPPSIKAFIILQTAFNRLRKNNLTNLKQFSFSKRKVFFLFYFKCKYDDPS